MHRSALEAAKTFFSIYCARPGLTVVDLGSEDTHGVLRSVVPGDCMYLNIGSPAAEVAETDPYRFSLANASVDVILASTCFERDPFFWLTMLEIARVLKEGGLCYMNVPSNGYYRPYTNDHWRFYPDAGKALEAWTERQGLPLTLLESLLLPQFDDEPWNDFIAVYCRGTPHIGLPQDGLCTVFDTATNVWSYGYNFPRRQDKVPEDRKRRAILEYRFSRIVALQRTSVTQEQRPVCNLCGGQTFGPGPSGRLATTGLAPNCQNCGSLERQRILRKVFQNLPLGFLDWRRALLLDSDHGLATTWFREYERSVSEGPDTPLIRDSVRRGGNYDFVSFNHVLEYIRDDQAAFAQIISVLSPQGVIQAGFSAPLSRPQSVDLEQPSGPNAVWHLYGRDLMQRFQCERHGLTLLAVEEADPCTGVREVIHLFCKDPNDVPRLRFWLASSSSAKIIRTT